MPDPIEIMRADTSKDMLKLRFERNPKIPESWCWVYCGIFCLRDKCNNTCCKKGDSNA